MSGDDKGASVGLEGAARTKLDDYLKRVGKDLKEVDPGEKKAILEEIDEALKEKLDIVGKEKSAGRVNGAMMDAVLNEFGSPSEVAREYTGMAAPAPGRGVNLFFAFLAVGSILLGIIGVIMIRDYFDALSMGWDPWPSQLLSGLFWETVMVTVLALLALQLRRQNLILALGQFTALAFLVPTVWGVSSLAWNDDISWLLPMVREEWKTPVIAAIGLGVVLPSLAGMWLLMKLAARERAREKTVDNIVPAARFRPARRFIAVATLAIVAMFMAANGTWLYLQATAPAGPKEGEQHFIGSEFVGGPYNASIEHRTGFYSGNWWDYYKIVYTFNGTKMDGYIQLEMRPAFDWIQSNTPSNSTIVSWWDYGHAIRGYTGRDNAIYMASKNLVNTMADRNKEGRPWESEEKVRMVCEALLAENETQLRQGMDALGGKYILTTERDASSIAYAVIEGAGKNPEDYLRTVNGVYMPKDTAQDMLLFKLWSGGDFNGTTVVYKDINTIILEVN